jgi:acyl-CoA thioester hydrolase
VQIVHAPPNHDVHRLFLPPLAYATLSHIDRSTYKSGDGVLTHDGYTHVISMVVRFGDLDAMGHLNNAKYATYIEQARIEYVTEVCGFRGMWNELGMILARIEIDFKAPILYGDTVHIYTRCARIGSKSFDLESLITRQTADLPQPMAAAASRAVLVALDYRTQQSIPVPQPWRTAMATYDNL